jgi:hypothetical protein
MLADYSNAAVELLDLDEAVAMPSGESGRTALFPASVPGAFIAHQAPVS